MSMEQGARTRLTTSLILLLVLATGSVLGVAIDRRLESRAAGGEDASGKAEARRSGEEQGEGERDPGASSSRRRLIVEQVGLTEAQKAKVDSIVVHYRQEMRDLEEELHAELQEAYMPRYRGLLKETREEIKGVLTPEQRMAYDSLLVEHDQRREQRRTRDSISDSRG
jgi:Spy/CpxP family protein refolding chaperone